MGFLYVCLTFFTATSLITFQKAIFNAKTFHKDRNIENIMHIEEKKYNTGNLIVRIFRLICDLSYLFFTECAREEIGNGNYI